MNTLQTEKGSVFPLGVTKLSENCVQVAVWCPKASSCELFLYEKGRKCGNFAMFSMKEEGAKDVYSIVLKGEQAATYLQGKQYDFLADGERKLDCYAKALSGGAQFGKRTGKVYGVMNFETFDWSGENQVEIPTDEMILYQCHLRGFTKHASSGVKHPGTFAGMQEKIPYMKELGVNTILLMPVYDFEEKLPEKINYWGYGKDAFYFAPKASYASDGNGIREFKELIKAVHQNKIQLFMDMYFENQTPEFILQCLRFYAMEYHVDGFRINQSALDVSWLKMDPVLSHVKLLGGIWEEKEDEKNHETFLEMNDFYMNNARRFLKSDEGQTEDFYRGFRAQKKGVGLIHYMTQHNGFTLRDLISYDVKHNEANGEKNQDGTEYNYSWNCGVEGPTRRKTVLTVREKQERNALVMLFLGLPIPMLLAGDEFGNSQKGNNNAYCQDNLTTWLDWRQMEKNKSTFEYVKMLISFRKKHALYHQKEMFTGMDGKGLGAPDISCHGREPWVADFSYYSREMGVLFYGGYINGENVYFAFNFHWDSHEFFLPDVCGNDWNVVLDTAKPGIKKKCKKKYAMAPRSIVVFESVCTPTGQGRSKK